LSRQGRPLRYLSVCSGIEAASVAWAHLGWECAGVAEIEPFPSAVLKHYYPNVRNYGDFTKIEASDVGSVDLLVGGPPCQDFSVAGLRAGIKGARGSLAIEFVRLAERLRPRWLLWENVPGVLSSDNGRAFETFVEAVEKAGYSIECDILDACHFGVPQRRRRIFVVGYLLESGRQRRMPYYTTLVLKFLTEICLSVLVEQCDPCSIGVIDSGFPSSFCADGLQNKMQLFGKSSGAGATLASLLLDLDAALPNGLPERASWDLASAPVGTSDSRREAMWSEATAMASVSLNTSRLWKNTWGVLCDRVNQSTTSTTTSKTTTSTIFSCATAVLLIVESMLPLIASCPTLFDGDSSGLIALKVFTNYARLADSPLLSGLPGVPQWGAFIKSAEAVGRQVERYIGDRQYTGTLLPVEHSLSGHPAPRRAAGQVAPTIPSRSSAGGGLGTDFDCDGGLIVSDIAPTLSSSDAGVERTGNERTEADFLVTTHALTGEGRDASEDGTGRGTPLVVEPMAFTQNSRSEVRLIGGDGLITGAVAAEPGVQMQNYIVEPLPIAFALRGRDEGSVPEVHDGGKTVGALRSASGGSTRDAVAFYSNMGEKARSDGASVELAGTLAAVRRLTPTECERLMGFPDDFTLVPYRGKPAADAPRYRALGNSMAVPVMRWIGERIAMVDEITGEDAA